jgi:hypothetical protein
MKCSHLAVNFWGSKKEILRLKIEIMIIKDNECKFALSSINKSCKKIYFKWYKLCKKLIRKILLEKSKYTISSELF